MLQARSTIWSSVMSRPSRARRTRMPAATSSRSIFTVATLGADRRMVTAILRRRGSAGKAQLPEGGCRASVDRGVPGGDAARQLADASVGLVLGLEDLHARQHRRQAVAVAAALVDVAQVVEDAHQDLALARRLEDAGLEGGALAGGAGVHLAQLALVQQAAV